MLDKFKDYVVENKFFILMIVTGFVAGIVAISLKYSIHYLMNFFETNQEFNTRSFLLGGSSLLIGGWLCTKWLPACAGSGVPRTKLVIAVHHSVITFKEWVTKFFSTVFSLASGLPLGYEGPTINITAGIGSSLGHYFQLKERKLRELLLVGSAAGISAAFGTPIAAVIFTIEEMGGNFSSKSMGPLLISSLIASITANAFMGQNSIFTPLHYQLSSHQELPIYLLLGIVAGVSGPLFIKNTLQVKKITKRFFKHHTLTPIMFSFGLLGVFSFLSPQILGGGIEVVNQILQGKISDIELLTYLILFKFIVSASAYGTGVSGGILMPVLFIGASLGGLFGSTAYYFNLLPEMEIGAFALVGMGALFASVIKTPFTSIILVFEMTRDYRILLPLMLGSLVAYFLSEKILKGSIYEYMSSFDGIELPTHDEEDNLINSTVDEIYVKEFKKLEIVPIFSDFIFPDQSLSYALTKMKKTNHQNYLIVLNRLNTKEQLGLISLKDITKYLKLIDESKKSE